MKILKEQKFKNRNVQKIQIEEEITTIDFDGNEIKRTVVNDLWMTDDEAAEFKDRIKKK